MRVFSILSGFQLLFLLPFLLTPSCAPEERVWYQGYVEGEFIHVSSPLSGRLEQLSVRRGDWVSQGASLFALEREREAAAVREAESEVSQAQDRLADLEKGLRPTELAAVRARLNQARTAQELSRKEYERRNELFAQELISREQLDQARTRFEQDQARVRELQAELDTAGLGGREDLVSAARAQVESAQARMTQAQWMLLQKEQAAPQEGLIFDTLFEAGEYVPAARPVVTLLPPGRIILRFFVPEPMAGTLRPGDRVLVEFDGADKAFPATVTFISPQVEYTPPVIFSRETRAKLVFMVEARPRPEDAARFRPGQPVSVRLQGGERG
jgi:HlyD family secretion protein